MAEEHFNTAVGAFTGLDTLIKRITDGFTFWQRVQSSNQSVTKFKEDLDLQKARFRYWSESWGMDQPGQTETHNIRIRQSQLVLPYLQRIENAIGELGDEFNATLPAFTDIERFSEKDPYASQLGNSSISPQASARLDNISTTRWEKVNWATRETKLNEGMTALKDLLNELFLCFPIPKQDLTVPMLYLSSLRSQDPTTLASVGHVIDDPLQQGLAFSKALSHMPPSTQPHVLHLNPAKLIDNMPSSQTHHSVGTYDGKLVLIETKISKVPKNTLSQSSTLNARIENIVMRLQHEKKPHQLRTLPCLGVMAQYRASDEYFTTNYNIVYSIDTTVFFSLRALVSESSGDGEDPKERKARAKTGISLGQRFIVAHTLASAILCLHLADWLHKAIRSDNVLFFAESKLAAGSTLPYLVGFDYSRPDALGERTEDIVDKDEYVYYRHPDAHSVPVADFRQPLGGAGRYLKVYDIYSLGIILMELGLFRSARSIVRSYLGRKANISGEAIRNVLLDKGIPELKFRMGEVYAKATCVCLDGFFDNFDQYDLPGAFSKFVVRPLSFCQA